MPTKKEKAYAMACLIEQGYYDYFDKINWQPQTHRFKYTYDSDSTTYLTLKELAKQFDTLPKREQQQALEEARELVGYYVEIVPTFYDEENKDLGYQDQADICSKCFKTAKEAKAWFEELMFQDQSNYSAVIFFRNHFTNEWGKVETLC